MLDDAFETSASPGASPRAGNVIAFPGHRPGSLAERARARRDWLMARWAAERIGFDPGRARGYARRIAVGTSPRDTILHRIQRDFEAAGRPLGPEALYRKLDDFHIQAVIWARCTPMAGRAG